MDNKSPMEKCGRQCTAKSKQSGQRCKRVPIPGGTVCVMHGGGTAASRAKAEAMLAAAVIPSIQYLLKGIKQKKLNGLGVAVAKDFLDRAGHKAAEQEQAKAGVTINVNVRSAKEKP